MSTSQHSGVAIPPSNGMNDNLNGSGVNMGNPNINNPSEMRHNRCSTHMCVVMNEAPNVPPTGQHSSQRQHHAQQHQPQTEGHPNAM
jgi:hypothetical protein